jgi:hypothetical protein
MAAARPRVVGVPRERDQLVKSPWRPSGAPQEGRIHAPTRARSSAPRDGATTPAPTGARRRPVDVPPRGQRRRRAHGTACGAHPTEPCRDEDHASALRLLFGHDEDAAWCLTCRRGLAADLEAEPEPWHAFADEPAPRAEVRLADLDDRRLPDLAQLEFSVRALEAENSSIIATLGSLVFADDRRHEEAAVDDASTMLRLLTDAGTIDPDPEGRLS